MNFSNRLARGAWGAWAPIAIALAFGCGSDDGGTSSGATGTMGTGGATGSGGAAGQGGASGMAGAGAGAAGKGGAAGAGGMGGSSGQDAGTGKGGAAGKDGGAGKAGSAGKDGGAGAAGASGAAGTAGAAGMSVDAGRDADASMPPIVDASTDTLPPPGDGSVDDLIRELVARLKPAEIEAKYRALEAMSMPNRKTGTANYTMATEWVKGWLATEAPRLTVTYDDWMTYRNIEIKIPGTDPNAGMYVMGGHLDSVAAGAGMDDNGSGSLGVALLASAMSHYLYKSEIRLILFDAEESGFIGSIHYAQALSAAGCAAETCMKLFTNMDMLGNDPRMTGTVKVLFDVAAPKTAAQAVKGYIPGITIQEGTGNCHSSDDCGFSRNGYANAGELVEPVYSPQRHTVTDVCDNMNFDTLNKALQLGGAMYASMAGIHSRAP